jgi:hypothetical protein
MLSLILSHPYSNEVSFPRLEHVAVGEPGLDSNLLAIDADSSLVDQPPRVATTFRQLRFDEGAEQVTRVCHELLRHFIRDLALAKLGVEILFRALRGDLAMQSLHELSRQRSLRVARLHRQDFILLLHVQS